MSVPILPPEESHCAGIPVVMAIQARIAEAKEGRRYAAAHHLKVAYARWDGRLAAHLADLALVEATQTVSARLDAHVRQEDTGHGRRA